MFKTQVTILSVGTAAPLLASVVAADGVTRWLRVGVIARTETTLRVDFDMAAAFLLPAWEGCVTPARPGRALARIRFGVCCGRAGVAVVAEGSLTAEVYAAVATGRHQPMRRVGSTGLGPRPLRAFWPRA